jgi:hypothetical protein
MFLPSINIVTLPCASAVIATCALPRSSIAVTQRSSNDVALCIFHSSLIESHCESICFPIIRSQTFNFPSCNSHRFSLISFSLSAPMSAQHPTGEGDQLHLYQEEYAAFSSAFLPLPFLLLIHSLNKFHHRLTLPRIRSWLPPLRRPWLHRNPRKLQRNHPTTIRLRPPIMS